MPFLTKADFIQQLLLIQLASNSLLPGNLVQAIEPGVFNFEDNISPCLGTMHANKIKSETGLLLHCMGSALCCLKNADRINSQREQNNKTHQKTSLGDVRIWKAQLGYAQPIRFDYPSTITHKSFKQIHKDVGRTFPASPYFASEKHQELFVATLKKIAMYYPKVGYTQGINFIVGLLLMEGEGGSYAFTMFTKLATHPDLLCIGLYEEEFPLNRLYCGLLWQIVDAKKPRISRKFKECGIIDEIWIFQWFMTFFIYSFPLEIVNKFLTFIITHKKMAHPKLAAALILQLESQILNMESELELYEVLENLKDLGYWKKKIDQERVMREADKISDVEIKKHLEAMQMTNNKYWKYFLQPQADRKMKYLNIMDNFAEDRKAFIKDPTKEVFKREEKSISMLDSIEQDAIKRMALSLDGKIVQQLKTSVNRSKLWKSQLFVDQQGTPKIKGEKS